MSARAVIFDRDGVLVRTRLRELLGALLPLLPIDEIELGRRWRAFLGERALTDERDERATASAFLERLAEALPLSPSARAAVAGFDHGAYVEAFPDARPALDEIRSRGLRVGVLTNNSAALSAAGPLVAAGLADRVDVALTAQQIGAPKPEARAYLAMCEALDASPTDCVLFDDVAAWVDAARRSGLRAFRVDRGRERDDLRAGVVASLSAVGAAIDHGGAP